MEGEQVARGRKRAVPPSHHPIVPCLVRSASLPVPAPALADAARLCTNGAVHIRAASDRRHVSG